MKNFFLTFLAFLVLANSAWAQPAPESEPAPPKPPAVDLWGPYFDPMLVVDVVAKGKGGSIVTLRRAFVLHRDDFERISVVGSDLESCQRDLGACEQREVDQAAPPSFWGSPAGVVVAIGIGFAAGVASTIGIVYATGAAK